MRFLLSAALLLVFCATGLSNAVVQWTDGYGYSNKNPVTVAITKTKRELLNSKLVFASYLRESGYVDEVLSKMSLGELEAAYLEAELDELKYPNPPKAGFATQFVPTASRIIMPTVIRHMTSKPDELTELTVSFEEFFCGYEESAKGVGYQNDLAGSISCFVAAAFQVIDEKEAEEGGAFRLMQSIRLNFATPQFGKISAIEKQKFQEFMLTMSGFLLLSELVSFTEPTDVLELIKETARDVLINYLGIDPAKVTMTSEGLVSRSSKTK